MNKELTFLQKEHTPASPSYLMTLQPDGGLPRLLISPPRTGNCPLRGRMFEMDSNMAIGLKTENLNQQRVFLCWLTRLFWHYPESAAVTYGLLPVIDEGRKLNWEGQR